MKTNDPHPYIPSSSSMNFGDLPCKCGRAERDPLHAEVDAL